MTARLALSAAAVACLAAGCGGGGSAATSQTGDSARSPAPRRAAAPARLVARRPCRAIAHFDCATLVVPLDHSGGAPGRLRLRVAIQRTTKDPRGVLVALTGGPGQPGVPFVPRIRTRLGRALRGYRLVMLDQRGTGAHALRCPALQRAMGSSDLTVPPANAVTRCAAEIGPARRYFTTADTVGDLDALRAVLAPGRSASTASRTAPMSPSAMRSPTPTERLASCSTPSFRTTTSIR